MSLRDPQKLAEGVARWTARKKFRLLEVDHLLQHLDVLVLLQVPVLARVRPIGLHLTEIYGEPWP
eukprot:12881355-Heterocapsa_arctica.AAC.1